MNKITLLLFLLSALTVFGQQKKKRDKFPSYFGIIAAPVIPNNFVGATHTLFADSTGQMSVDFENKWGYTFGGIIRIGLSNTFSIETGLTQVRRNYNVQVSMPDSNILRSQRLAFVNYDVPINGLMYVKMDEHWYMNAALGISITQYPSDVRDSIIPGSGKSIVIEGRRIHRTSFAANAGVGFEFRTEKKGTFYLGASAKVPFQPVFFGIGIFKQSGNGNNLVAYEPVTAGYFTVDFRYFIPNTIRKQESKLLKGPIE